MLYSSVLQMSKILSNRDYHLTKFRVGKYLEKGADNLTPAEDNELVNLIAELRIYERENGLRPQKSLSDLLNEYMARKDFDYRP